MVQFLGVLFDRSFELLMFEMGYFHTTPAAYFDKDSVLPGETSYFSDVTPNNCNSGSKSYISAYYVAVAIFYDSV